MNRVGSEKIDIEPKGELLQTFHIPTNATITIGSTECFWLVFDETGTFEHNDHPGIHLKPKLPIGPVKASTRRTKYCAKKSGLVTCKFSPTKKKSLLSMHTILIGDR
jgi:hypothetical protein